MRNVLSVLSVSILLTSSCDFPPVESFNYFELFEASKSGNYEEAKMALEDEIDLNIKDVYGWTPLHYATLLGHTEIVKFSKKRERSESG